MGPRDKSVRKTSFASMAGLVRSSATVCWVVAADGAWATLMRMSPICTVTAVHGRVPRKAPRKQSHRGIEQTPDAMLMPDHGTTPMRRRIDKRIHAGDWLFVGWVDTRLSSEVEMTSALPCRAALVSASAFGNRWEMSGARGLARRVDKTDPSDVKRVIQMVARIGLSKTPARMFWDGLERQRVQMERRKGLS